ncbi:MAG TPA: ATP-binding protein [Ferruginibacter sp.]|nr:ATP-binding protein [Ferruginibacter sp.]
MKSFLPAVLFCLYSLLDATTAFGQHAVIDSLKRILATQTEDTNKVNTLNQLAALQIKRSDFSKSLEYANKALTLAEALKFTRGKAESFKNMGSSYQNFNEAIKYLNNALTIFNKIGDTQNIGNCNYEMGKVYFYLQQNIPEALKSILIALRFYEDSRQKIKIADCYRLLGLIYSDVRENTEALTQLFNALKIYKELKDSVGTAYTYNLIGEIKNGEHKESEALRNHFHALEIYKQLGKSGPAFGIPWTIGLIANIYLQQAETAEALGHNTKADNKFTDALELLKSRLKLEKEGEMSHIGSYIQLGRYYMDLSNRTFGKDRNKYILNSKMYYEKALDQGKQSGQKQIIADSYSSLSYLSVLLKNYKEAYINQSKFILYKDSLINEQTTKKIIQSKMQFEFSKKEAVARAEQGKKDAETKRIKNLQYIAISSLGVIVLAVSFIVSIQWRNNKHKQNANALLQHQKEKVESTLEELKATQAQLIQSEKMASLGELTAGIAHEIQNPLNFVNNFSEVNTELIEEMKEEMDKGNFEVAKAIANDIKDNEQKINHHGKRADAIVKGMLQHSRSTSATKEPTDINKLADEYLRLAYHGLRAKDKSFNAIMKTDYDDSIGNISIIPQDIGRVILNLITNAFYAAPLPPEGGFLDPDYKHSPTIWVSTKKMDDKVFIRVKDNGPGIPKKILDKIFQPFFTTKPTGQGTGLGLSLSYDIVKAHGGEIMVETKEGEGTSFILKLPIT